MAARVGVPVPEPEDGDQDPESRRDRETMLRAHEIAAAWFREQLAGPQGAAARRLLVSRGLTPATIELLGMGYAPPSREALKTKLLREGFAPESLARTGLVSEREGGMLIDRFRNRLMIPIARDNGAIIAFGGRAMDEGQVPKYLNSPETAIYVKGRTLYGLHLSKAAIVKAKHAVMVEGYFDVAQALQGGIPNVVASSGTALTPAQARLLKRFASKVVLSFDPDAAGKGAAVRIVGAAGRRRLPGERRDDAAGRGSGHLHPARGRGRVCGETPVVAAISRVLARSGRRGTGSAAGRAAAGVPEPDARSRGADPGCGGA